VFSKLPIRQLTSARRLNWSTRIS